MSESSYAEGTKVRNTQAGTEGDDVPDKMQLQGGPDRQPLPYEGEGTHRFETRMSDEEIAHGISRDARRAAEVMAGQKHGDKVERPSADESAEKAMGSQPTS